MIKPTYIIHMLFEKETLNSKLYCCKKMWILYSFKFITQYTYVISDIFNQVKLTTFPLTFTKDYRDQAARNKM